MGDCTIVARVASVQGSDGWTKTGLMVRETLQFDSANALSALTPQNGTYFSYRSATSGSTTGSASSGSAPYWVKLVRSGNSFTGYRASNSNPNNWTQIGSATIPMAANVFVGLALTAHNSILLSTSRLDNVSITCQLPAAPAPLLATAGNSQVAMQWPSVPAAATYNLKRSTAANGPYTNISTGLFGTNFTDSTVLNGTTYYYVVSSFNLNGEGTNSLQATATPQPPAPAAPTALAAAGGVGRISLTWNASALATNYFVKRSTTAGGGYTLLSTTPATSFLDTNVVLELPYYYVVLAVNGGGESPPSNEAGAVAHAPPLLTVALNPAQGQLTLSWPGWASDLSLFAATDLAPPVFWSQVTNAVIPGDPITTTIAIEQGSRFFRLASP